MNADLAVLKPEAHCGIMGKNIEQTEGPEGREKE